MKAKYIGAAQGAVSAFGTTFEQGKATEVPERYERKVEGNRFFQVVGERPTAKPSSSPSGGDNDKLVAKHRGGGSYSIVRGDTEVKEGLTKADADTFNGMSDEDKAAYVADEQ